jgi:hypothetical protein
MGSSLRSDGREVGEPASSTMPADADHRRKVRAASPVAVRKMRRWDRTN